MHLKLHHPSDSELSDFVPLDITRVIEWHPMQLQKKMSTLPRPGPVPGSWRSNKPEVDYSTLCPFFGWLPTLTVEKTLASTTQLGTCSAAFTNVVTFQVSAGLDCQRL